MYIIKPTHFTKCNIPGLETLPFTLHTGFLPTRSHMELSNDLQCSVPIYFSFCQDEEIVYVGDNTIHVHRLEINKIPARRH